MPFNTQTRSNLLVLATILSASSLASATSPTAPIDALPERIPRVSDLPPWSPLPPAGRLDRNLKAIRYSGKVVPVQAYLDDGSETLDDSHAVPGTDKFSLARRTLIEGELEALPKDEAGSSILSMTNGLRTNSEWFPPSAPTESSSLALIPVAADTNAEDSTLSKELAHCNWLDGTGIGGIGVLVFAVMAAGTMVVLRLLWRRSVRARRRARKENLGLGFVKWEVDMQPGSEIEKAGLLRDSQEGAGFNEWPWHKYEE
jgi:hypothetical protein